MSETWATSSLQREKCTYSPTVKAEVRTCFFLVPVSLSFSSYFFSEVTGNGYTFGFFFILFTCVPYLLFTKISLQQISQSIHYDKQATRNILIFNILLSGLIKTNTKNLTLSAGLRIYWLYPLEKKGILDTTLRCNLMVRHQFWITE